MVPFADADVNAGASLVACVMAALGGLFAWLNVREKRLSDRDRLAADAEKAQMKTDIAVLKVQVGDCHEDRDGLRAEVGQLRAAMERHGIECPKTHPGGTP